MYLRPSEYASYGIPDATAQQIEAAGRLIDGYLGRPEGLLWEPDATGEPGWMSGMTPARSYALSSPIAPGTAVAIAFPFARFGPESIGEVVVLDRADPAKAEACVVAAASGNAITLQGTHFGHAAGATIEFGLTIRQEARGPVRIGRSPVARIFSAQGRYSYGREVGRLSSGCDNYEALLVTNYGQNNVSGWNALDTASWDINTSTGAIRTPLDYFETVRLQYVAGWSYATLPVAIKQAVARLVSDQNSLISEGFAPGIRVLKSGDATIERFAGSGGQEVVIDSAVAALLAPYKTYRI